MYDRWRTCNIYRRSILRLLHARLRGGILAGCCAQKIGKICRVDNGWRSWRLQLLRVMKHGLYLRVLLLRYHVRLLVRHLCWWLRRQHSFLCKLLVYRLPDLDRIITGCATAVKHLLQSLQSDQTLLGCWFHRMGCQFDLGINGQAINVRVKLVHVDVDRWSGRRNLLIVGLVRLRRIVDLVLLQLRRILIMLRVLKCLRRLRQLRCRVL